MVTPDEQVKDYELSRREIDVREQLSKGANYNQIAEVLFISPFTVRKHIENIYEKLQVHNKIQAVEKAKKNKII
jgi:DNA-binding NarL/FixJ family response regulator